MADENQQNNENNQQQNQPPTVKQYLITNKYDTCLWLIRIYMIFSTVLYIVPLLGMQFSASSYKRVLIGSAAISALRIHQRMPRIQFSVEFAKQLVLEDSFHYFSYSVLFLIGSQPATVILMPIFIFAVMHAATYTRKVIEVSGTGNSLVLKFRQLISKIENREIQQQMLLFIATTEILVFALSVLMMFGGQATILVPFFYYRFLQLRYSSRRNPYSKLAFSRLRLSIEQLSNHPKCPSIGRKILLGIVSIAVRFCPTQAAA